MTADSRPSAPSGEPAAPSGEPAAAIDREDSVLDDLVAGGIFVALGLAYAIGARGYELGTAFRMGPGYVPLVLGGVLALLGFAIIGVGVVRWRRAGTAAAETPHGAVPWRAIALLTASIIVFGAGVEPLGLVPALLVTTFLAALADRNNSLLASAVIAVGLTVACVLIFVVLLQLRLPLLGSVLGG
ncbi:tripartite tricarboxylate transporter TctB family protein [Aeromicrobium sp.]|uniref:tripartite tricarboxylate transporter TctB family protein n=1 Tax=Aeromicrobium sp. TaxID=1871063 RepID=UPI003D6AA46E